MEMDCTAGKVRVQQENKRSLSEEQLTSLEDLGCVEVNAFSCFETEKQCKPQANISAIKSSKAHLDKSEKGIKNHKL